MKHPKTNITSYLYPKYGKEHSKFEVENRTVEASSPIDTNKMR